MPPRNEAIEPDLKSFLAEATLAYAEGAMDEEEFDENLKAGAYSSGPFTITDTYRFSADSRVYSGIEEVTHHEEPVWRAAYHGAILDGVKPEKVLDIYQKALKKPDPELPIRGPRSLRIGQYEYKLDSTHGPLSVARFAIIEEIKHKNRRVYRGDISGGLI